MPTTINSTVKGKAYEYACVLALQEIVSPIRTIVIIESSSMAMVRQRYGEVTSQERRQMLLSAKAGINKIIEMEPKILEDGGDTLTVSIQSDRVAQETGDVRDVLIIRNSIHWEIGVSVKHNHAALKHSRLSMTIDFGEKWLGVSCSDNYFEEIRPMFDRLERLKAQGKLWSELPNTHEETYMPILNAFKREIESIVRENRNASKALIRYLFGSNGKDYYKLIHRNNNVVRIMPFNFCGMLNGNTFPESEYPTRIIELDYKENSMTTLVLTMDKGWSFSLRIHSAKTAVEPSLKFDINLISIPASLFYLDVEW